MKWLLIILISQTCQAHILPKEDYPKIPTHFYDVEKPVADFHDFNWYLAKKLFRTS
jgi:hypothetical protein